ncbi:FHA domain-containing protein [Rubinisphaera italica]|uniref:FHA domain-containing protein FhaA n=1 Tax=Rubinisphaera italica TaxID=2527969 RepID=A0A5C5XDL5_9PLAN|nr:FHA domain-containing protein [Rubinisphaera italica]TWT61196.1 FHA domain-containing protein FhaA [Rubinisphaera italica]
MARISLQVIQGLERGQVHSGIRVPITIGREEDNAIQLNDERISRCHVKIQQDSDRIILTDLQSTNGTRVNGLPVQMTVLRPGDLITIGRCVLLFGSQEEIAEHCNELHKKSLESHRLIDTGNTLSGIDVVDSGSQHGASNMDTIGLFDDHGHPAAAFPGGCPPIPQMESLHSRSELADLLAYLHARMLQILESRGLNDNNVDENTMEGSQGPVSAQPMDYARIPWDRWNQLLELEVELAKTLKKISEPD